MTHSNDNLGVQMSLLFCFCFCFSRRMIFFIGWAPYGYLKNILCQNSLSKTAKMVSFSSFNFGVSRLKRLLLVFVRHYFDVFPSHTQIEMIIVHHWLRKGALRQSYHGSLMRTNEPRASSKLVTGGVLRYKKIIIETVIPLQIPFFFRVLLVGGMKRRWHWIKYGRLVQSCRLYQPNSHLHFPLMATPCNEELNFNRGSCNANMRLSTFPSLTGHVLSCCPHPDWQALKMMLTHWTIAVHSRSQLAQRILIIIFWCLPFTKKKKCKR